MECQASSSTVADTGRIYVKHVAAAVRQSQSMNAAQKVALIDQIYIQQPNLLASILVQSKFGASEQTLELLLELLIVCHLAMNESGYEWPLITEEEQERQLGRTVGAVSFSETLTDPVAANAARQQYIVTHPEPALLALVMDRCNQWLADLAQRHAEQASDKYVMLAATNLVNCIAHAPAHRRRPS
jgi:hypothetical protein